MFSMDNFGEWLIETLRDKKISQSELSKISGLSRGTLSNIISGARGRGHESLTAIAKALRIPPEQVFRHAGLLPQLQNTDDWVEEMNYKITLIPPGLRSIAENLIDSMLVGEEAEPVKPAKPRSKTSTGKA